ncbi:MAG TPA: protein-export chaperone SecB [Afifellaceae bacterium]|nr:protein-export chaperone SecB [Afifellaceae bacterium]
MSESTNGGGSDDQKSAGADAKQQKDASGEAKQQGRQQQQPPGIHVLGQYIKDLSFENPVAPKSLRPSDVNPELQVNVNVNAKALGDNAEFEVELKLSANAKRGDETMFIAEVLYGGVFQVRNVSQEHVRPMVLIECPRLLFPFARQILADVTRQGGFPPLLIDPVDFASLYRQKLAEENVQQAAAQSAQA